MGKTNREIHHFSLQQKNRQQNQQVSEEKSHNMGNLHDKKEAGMLRVISKVFDVMALRDFAFTAPYLLARK